MARFWILVLLTATGILAALGTLTDMTGPGHSPGNGSGQRIATATDDSAGGAQRSEEPVNRRAADRRAQRSAATAMARDEERTLQVLLRAAPPADHDRLDRERAVEPPAPPAARPAASAEQVAASIRSDDAPAVIPRQDLPLPSQGAVSATIEPELPRGVEAAAMPEAGIAAETVTAAVPIDKAGRRILRPKYFARKPRPPRAGRSVATRRLVARRLVQQDLTRPVGQNSASQNSGG